MKSIIAFTQTILKSLGILTMIFLVACSGGNDRKVADDFENKKEELIEGLEKLEADIDDAMDDVKDKMNIDEGPIERNWEETQKSLEKKKKEVQASLRKAKNSTKSNWDKVKGEVNESADDIKEGFNDLKNEISDALDGDK